MPTYEYACDACGAAFEREQRITEDPIKVCPACGKESARRQISGGGFILKGGGWYADLYHKPSGSKSGGDGGSGGSGSSGSSGGSGSGGSSSSSGG